MTDRRRALMMAGGVVLPPVPSGYITDGLVFFLDGKQLATASTWTDIVGGKVFDLTDCTLQSNGVAFDQSTSVGTCAGQITNSWNTETIEVVFTGHDHYNGAIIMYNKAVLCQPYMNNSVGISLRFGNNGSVRAAIGLDGVNRSIRQWPAKSTDDNYVHLISVNSSRIVFNKNTTSGTSNSSYSKNTTGNTVLGAVATSSISGRQLGIIHAVRIYNRLLSEQEMKDNQANDLIYYGLSL